MRFTRRCSSRSQAFCARLPRRPWWCTKSQYLETGVEGDPTQAGGGCGEGRRWGAARRARDPGACVQVRELQGHLRRDVVQAAARAARAAGAGGYRSGTQAWGATRRPLAGRPPDRRPARAALPSPVAAGRQRSWTVTGRRKCEGLLCEAEQGAGDRLGLPELGSLQRSAACVHHLEHTGRPCGHFCARAPPHPSGRPGPHLHADAPGLLGGPGGKVTLTRRLPRHSSVPSGGTRAGVGLGRETTRNQEEWGTWQWAQSRWRGRRTQGQGRQGGVGMGAGHGGPAGRGEGGGSEQGCGSGPGRGRRAWVRGPAGLGQGCGHGCGGTGQGRAGAGAGQGWPPDGPGHPHRRRLLLQAGL